MNHFGYLLFCLILVAACKKEDKPNQNSSSVCFQVSYLNVNNQNGLESVFFLNGKDGFVASYNGDIYKTVDSAKNWTLLNSTTNLPIRAIYFLDAYNGFAVGGESGCFGTGCVSPGGFILRTQDAGQTWNKVFTPFNKFEITSIAFINNTIGFCVGGNVIYKTENGGQSWREYQVNNLGGNMMKIKFIDSQNGFIVCLADKILKTTDGGVNWHVTSPNKNIGYYSLSGSNGAIYVSGQGKVLKSLDNGISWNELGNSPTDIYDIHFTSQNMGYAFGRGNYSGDDFGYSYGSMYCTDNGGKSWNGNGDFKDIGLIKAISFPSGNIGYAISGNRIIKITLD